MAIQDQVQNPGGGMTVREAGKRGGEATKEKYGPSFYEVIGQKGGQKLKRKSS